MRFAHLLRMAPLLTITCLGAHAAEIDKGKAPHWAYVPVTSPRVPQVKNSPWVRSSLDAFIAVKHEAKGLTPAPEASRRVLIRRLSLDLTGLPPTPAEIDAFLGDAAPDAYEKLVDRLLASPHYGERWGRHWLDLARWAESEGYESNHLRPYAWRYRDYVVDSFNCDKPYTQLVREQIAGDEIEPYSDQNLIATGFLAAARLSSNEEDKARQRNDVLVDVVNATASTFLGLTLHCAECHNHKFDALTLRDYYRFMGFFVKGQPANLTLKDPELWARYRAACTPEYEATKKLQQLLYTETRDRMVAEARTTLSGAVVEALAVPPDRRTPEQEQRVRALDSRLHPPWDVIEKNIRPEDRTLYRELKKKLAVLERRMPDVPQTLGFYSPATSPTRTDVLTMQGFFPLPYEPQELAHTSARLLVRGDVHRPGTVLDAGWPEVFGPTPKDMKERGSRRALADWLNSPANPLSARVWVNRLWQYHFGRGLVATASDFGVRGAPPTHPELLDWLAGELRRSNGSAKHLHRLIVCSATYRQSSRPNEANSRIDPDNSLWWHWSPRRLEAEVIRDAMLAVSGELDPTAGGPSDADHGQARRRTLYLLQKREQPPAVQALFDGPFAAAESCPRRSVSTVPLQSLYLLNNAFTVDRGRAFARRVLAQAGTDRDRQCETAFVLALGRPPDPEEREAARTFFLAHVQDVNRPGEPPLALVHYCQALLNVNEFVYLE